MDRRDFLKHTGAALLALGAAGGLQGCARLSKRRRGRRPNILWVFMDDCRQDAVGCYGQPWVRTPHMDAVAAAGVRFETAVIQNPVCVPSRRSMKTGLYAHEIGPVGMGHLVGFEPDEVGGYIDEERMERLEDAPNLLDRFAMAGMQPVNVGKIHGFGRSWDRRGDAPLLFNALGQPTEYARQRHGDRLEEMLDVPRVFTPTHGWQLAGVLDIRPEDTETWRLGDMALDTLDELAAREDPFFLRVSFHAPHVACYVPEGYFIDPATIDLPMPTPEQLDDKPRFEKGPLRTYAGGLGFSQAEIDLARGTYYGMVSLVDVQVGRLMAALQTKGLLESTVVAINSDQGFQLGEHGMWKKRVFYEQNVCVPMILSCPSMLPAGRVVDAPVEMVDFFPTLMDMAGLGVPRDIRGRSLVPLMEGRTDTWREACFSEIDHSQSMYEELRQGTGRRVMVRTREWKLIFFMDDRVADKDGALYDLRNDPGETVNLFDDPAHQAVVRQLEHLAYRWDKGNQA